MIPRGGRDPKDSRDPNNSCDPKDSRAPKSCRDPKASRGPWRPVATRKPGKQKIRGPVFTLSEGEGSSAGEEATLAALSGSRF